MVIDAYDNTAGEIAGYFATQPSSHRWRAMYRDEDVQLANLDAGGPHADILISPEMAESAALRHMGGYTSDQLATRFQNTRGYDGPGGGYSR